jgi:DNA-binding CsgD family transcriptional regulator
LIGCHDDKIKDISKGDILELAEAEDCDLTALEKSVLAYRMLGYSFTDIGKIFKRSYRQISRIVERIGTKHRHRFED